MVSLLNGLPAYLIVIELYVLAGGSVFHRMALTATPILIFGLMRERSGITGN